MKNQRNPAARKGRSLPGTGIGKKQGAALISDRITRACSILLVFFPLTLLMGSAVADIFGILIGLGFLLHSALSRNWEWVHVRWVQVAIALYLYIVLRSFFAESPPMALGRAAPWLRYFLFAGAIAFWLYHVPNVRRYLPHTLSATVVFLVGDMLFQYWTGFDILSHTTVASDGGSVRLTGPYTGPRAGITLTWIAWPIIAYLLACAESRPPYYKLLAGALWGLTLIAVFLSGERMATLLAMMASILLVLFLKEARRCALWLVPLAALAISALLYFNPPLAVRQVDTTITAAGNAEGSPYGRIWISTLKVIKDYPIFGVGAKHFRTVCLQEPYGGQEVLNCNLHPHHLYLEWWVEQGLLGLSLFLAMIYYWCREAGKHIHHHRRDALFVGLAVACVVKLFPFSTAVSFFASWSALPFWFMLGWLLAICDSEEP